ncbi:MAG: Ig-like domain-containing protein, partial [Nitrospira sp.]|nr:Ig-like domain-containing protein [Nitrospira sp.]
VKPGIPEGTPGARYLFHRFDPSWGEELGLLVNTAGAVGFVVGTTNASSVFYTAPGVVAFDEFAHIAATVDTVTGRAHIYVNGVETPYATPWGPETVSGTLANVNQLYLGRRYGGGVVDDAYFKGLMDDVRLYKRALTAIEVESLSGYLAPGGRFHGAGDIDAYTVNLLAGQTVTVRLTPQDSSIQARVEVVGADGTTVLGSEDAAGPGASVLVQTVPVSTAGIYTIRITDLAGSGTYQLATTLNAAVEAEHVGGASNNTLVTAQDLTASVIALQGTATRLAVTGMTEAGQSDYYRFDLAAGQAATVVLGAAEAQAALTVELYDGNGVLLATGIKETINVQNQAIRNVVAPTAGTYYARISGEANRVYTLVVTKAAAFDRESNSTITTAQDISATGQVLGSLGSATEAAAAIDSQDHYLIRANAGDVLTITTRTPGGASNNLNPKLELFTQTGTTALASDANSAGDSRNALIANFSIATTGVYRLVVSRESGAGDYTLHVTGATGAPVPFTIVSQTVPNGELRATYPTTFRVDLSEPLNLSSVQASDLQIQSPGGASVSADSVTIIDHDTVEFTITSAHTGDGVYTLTIPAGALTSLTNKPLQTAVTSTFDLDATPPRVFNANLIEGATVAPDANGNLTVTIQFTEPLAIQALSSNGLVSWWRADGNADDSQDGNAGSVQNGAAYAMGVDGQAFQFDGVDDYVQIGAKPNLVVTNAATISAWIRPTGVMSGNGVIVNKEGEYQIAIFPDGTLRWALANTNPGWVWINTGAVVSLNQWTHVALTYEAGTAKTYLNGMLVHTYAGAGNIGDVNTSMNDFRIGGRQGAASSVFQGLIDDVRVYNRALSGAELASVLGPDDVALRDTVTNGSYAPAQFAYNPSANSLTLTYTNLPDSAYALTLLSSSTGFRDLRGHLLDGDANGTAGGNWVRSFVVDTAARAYPASLQALAPSGSLIYTDNPLVSNSGPISWWQGEGSAMDSVDGNNGTLQGGAT